MTLGQNIRLRRKKLKLSQEQLAAGSWTRSYISQIESDRLKPPLDTLITISTRLDTTVSDLVGDDILLRKAKATIFQPQICHQYLAQLPKTPTTTFLYQLADSLQTNKPLECQIPPNAELYYLTARMLISQRNYQEAYQVLNAGIKLIDKFWRILFLNQLCHVAQQLKDQDLYQMHKEQLGQALVNIDSIEDLRQRIAQELHYEQDPVRSNDLIMFLQVLVYCQDLAETLHIIG